MDLKNGIKIIEWPQYSTFKVFLPCDIKDCKLRAINIPRYIFTVLLEKNIVNEKSKHTVNTVYTTKDFLDTLCSTDTCTFTYCFKNDGTLYLCKTTGKQDYNRSKHMRLCRTLKTSNKLRVCSAGNIKIDKIESTIYIDNLSGTYKPSLHHMESLQKCLQHFNGLTIEILTPHKDESHTKHYCKRMDSNAVDYHTLCKGGTRRKTISK